MSLNEQQIKAIEESGHNIIVSAGAGSGKTHVLTERVFDRISNPKYKWNIDEMLVLTFTNAAAANMKQRIRNKLLNDINNKLSKEEKQKQINKLDSSYIMTFDAYAQFVVKKYNQELNIDKNIRIIDANIIKIKTQEIINEIVLEKYKNKDERFVNLVNDFCVKDDFNIRDEIYVLNNKLNSIYNRKEYISNYEINYYSENAIDNKFIDYENLMLSKLRTINNYLNELSNYVEDYHQYFLGIDILLNSKNYDEIRNNLNIDTSKQMRGQGEEAKQIKKLIVEEIKNLKSLCTFSKEELKKQILNTKDNVLCLLSLAEEVKYKLDEYKNENNMYEFSDVFNMAIELVDKNEEIRNEIKNSFKEIMIDEYQDTNDLQDEFISMIESNNVYMVGDIKQSIYKFRNANPELFKTKYECYKNNKDGSSLKLSYNYRSRKQVIDSIDVIFNRIMDLNIGNADYKNEHHMIFGNNEYKDIDNQSNETEILSYKYDNETKAEYPFDSLEPYEVEAFIIAKDIENKIKSSFKVSSRTTKINEKGEKIEVLETRKAEYRDFTILVDRGTNFDVLKQILTSKGIPCEINTEEKLDESDLVTVTRAIFKLICSIKNKDFNYDFKHAYLSLSRSFLIEMSDSELFDIVTNNTYIQTDLYKRVLKIVENIETKTISNILDEFIIEFDVYNKLTKIGDVYENFVKIDYLYQLATSLNESGYNYESFNDYLINIFDTNDEDTIKFKIQKENQNAVTITNIHQSKGLEYNICYYPLLNVKFNKQDIKEGMIFDKKHGLIIPSMIKDKGLKQTIAKEVYKQEYLIKDLSERIRLFYVALTRAKEKIILVCPTLDNTKDGEVIDDETRLTINKYSDLLNIIYEDIKQYIKEINFEEYKDYIDKDYRLSTKEIFNLIPDTQEKLEVKEDIEINPIIIDKTGYSKKTGLLSSNIIEKMELGSKIHYYLEVLNFNNPNYDLVENEYKEFVKAFLDNEIMKNKNEAKVYKEYEFIYENNDEKKHGFIDLLMEYDDHFDIIDYKTKNIDDENYDEQLLGYKKYIESISDKKVNCYLYSIVEKTYREIK